MTAQERETHPQGIGGNRVSRRTLGKAAVGAAALGVAGGMTAWSATRHYGHDDAEPEALSRRLASRRVSGDVPRDPTSAAWRSAESVSMPLMQQYMVAPRLQATGLIPQITLRSMHNGEHIGFHVSWNDPDTSEVESAGHFRDSVAVQLPIKTEGPVGVVMGQPTRPVHILHWRASWQRLMEHGTGTIRDAFPNAVSDVSPEDVLPPDLARTYYPALNSGNAMAIRPRPSAVEELVAQGFGTVTTQAEQRAEGTGTNSAGTWEVVIIVPMTGGENQATVRPGTSTAVALAVWNGGKGDRGARKQFADWTGLDVEA